MSITMNIEIRESMSRFHTSTHIQTVCMKMAHGYHKTSVILSMQGRIALAYIVSLTLQISAL